MAEGENFNLDVAAVGAWTESLKTARSESEGAMQNIAQIRDIMTDLQSLGKNKIISPEERDTAEELNRFLFQLGVPLKEIQRLQKEITSLTAEEAKNRKDVAEATGMASKSSGKTVDSFKKINTTLKSAASSVTGVQLSLLGILALFLKIYNESNRIAGMSKQIQGQWDTQNKSLKSATGLMGELRGNFKLSYDAIGEYLNSLAKAGMEQKDMNGLASELLGIQYAQGQSVADQVSKLQGLVNSFGLATDIAQDHLVLLREEAKTLGDEGIMMSMGEYVNTWTELVDKRKAYNTDLLGTTALYNTLIKKAADIGLGQMPVALRQELSKTVAGFSAELEDGWKAALGEGSSIAGKILDFESLGVPEQFERFASFINEKASAYTGDTQKIVVRELLKNFGFTSKEMQKAMSDAFTEGAFNEKNLQNVMTTIREQRVSGETLEARAQDLRKKLLKAGSSIATNLTSLEQKIKNYIHDELRPLVLRLTEGIEALVEVIGAGIKALNLRFPTKGEAKEAGEAILSPIDTIELLGKGLVSHGKEIGREQIAATAAQLQSFAKPLSQELKDRLKGSDVVGQKAEMLRFQGFSGGYTESVGYHLMKLKQLDPNIIKNLAALEAQGKMNEAVALFERKLKEAIAKKIIIVSKYNIRSSR